MIFWRSLNSKQILAALSFVKIAVSKSKTNPKTDKKAKTPRSFFSRKVVR